MASIRTASLGIALSLLTLAPAVAQTSPAQPYLDEARTAAASGRYIDALAAHAQAIAAAPDHVRAYTLRAELFLSLSHTDLASGDYRKAVALKPDDARLQANLCWTLAQANHDLDGALAACNAAVTLHPADYDILSKRGYLHLRRGAWAAAEKDFADALGLNTASPHEMFGHGVATIQLGQVKDGRDEIASAVLDSPTLVNEWIALGFDARGDIRSSPPLTTAKEPVISDRDMKVFFNRGEETYFGFKGKPCGRVIAPVNAAELGATMFEHADMTWTAECRFGLIHGEGKLARGSENAPTTRYVYGRAIEPGPAGEAKARKLTLAYQVLEEAAAP
jgi:Flp pilus assembly protein TadD